mgnify:CR=1 FL=1
MNNQMEMFENGGLSDEGGTIDGASGNDVPVGSLKEEVRDDIPAQLSEGEFVLPADVVRYHGLDKIMRLRDEAKAGLSRMEDMGQMGNSEEAVLPDGMPFNMEDLEMDEDSVSNDVPFNSDDLEMNVGGLVPQQQPYGVIPQNTNTYNIPSAFTTYQQQQPYSQQNVVAPVTPVTTTVPGFVQPPMAPRSQFSFKDLMPGTVKREELYLAGKTGAPQVDTSAISKSNAATNAPTGSTATDLANAAVTGYTAYKVAPKVIAGAKSAYAALTGGAKAAKTGALVAQQFSQATPAVSSLLATPAVPTKGGAIAAQQFSQAPFQAPLNLPTLNPIAPYGVSNATTGVVASSGKAGLGINAQFGGPGGIGYAAPTFVAAIALYSLFQGMVGMPSGKKNREKRRKEVRDKRIKEVIIPFKQMMSGIAGVPYEELLASQQAPKTPWQDMEDDIRASGVGDLDYELDNAKTMFQNSPVFQKQNEEFLAEGDNA